MIETTVCLLLRETPAAGVLLGLKKRGFGRGKYGGFGGKIEPGETPQAACVRELAEEAGIYADEADLEPAALLTFEFPARREWDIRVRVFVARRWRGNPVESAEMRPAWFAVAAIPYGQMWADAVYWLPRVLSGERLRAHFVYGTDSETVIQAHLEEWTTDDRQS